jgi:hypothetical protein
MLDFEIKEKTMNLELVNEAQQNDKETIKLLKARKFLSIPLLSKLSGFGETRSRRILERLCSKGYCHQVKKGNKLYFYEGSSPKTDLSGKYTPTGRFYGIKWEPEVNRPGCQDFLKCPSRVGDNLIPHRPMMHGAMPRKNVA